MQWDYVYANLQVQVTFDADGTSPFGQLTDRETMTLQQLIYVTLTAFVHTRALYAADVAALQMRIDAEKKALNKEPDGG